MKPSKLAKKAVLALLSSKSLSKQEILNEIVVRSQQHQGHHNDDEAAVTTRHVSRALEKLARKGKVIESSSSSNGTRMFSLSSPAAAVVTTDSCASQEDDSKEVGKTEQRHVATAAAHETIPFAELIRRKHAYESATTNCDSFGGAKQEKSIDIDDEIRRLEAELADDDEDESEYDSVNEDETSDLMDKNKQVSFGAVQVKEIESSSSSASEQSDDRAVVCLSTVANDRIAPLPAGCLPQTRKRTLKGIDDVGESSGAQEERRSKKQKQVSDGLRDAVKEVLSGYVARSSERLPFYCRVCAKQYTTETEFANHKSTNFHKMAVQVERKASFCKLCRKQFTSPVQLKEHVSSRPHKERLAQVRSRQSHPTRGGQSQSHENAGRSRRQWC